ncbi:hypothetical protein P7K49_035256 [Saguinus oedipus]|uniref:Uncharacterized protein n=1 Tax=Saguinus oedipus TaxID=9490 RepID=A0ABQ9TM36_SAGOE|nr:hypothetical protein P7K49_035256 [Saguinus oedipus]
MPSGHALSNRPPPERRGGFRDVAESSSFSRGLFLCRLPPCDPRVLGHPRLTPGDLGSCGMVSEEEGCLKPAGPAWSALEPAYHVPRTPCRKGREDWALALPREAFPDRRPL